MKTQHMEYSIDETIKGNVKISINIIGQKKAMARIGVMQFGLWIASLSGAIKSVEITQDK